MENKILLEVISNPQVPFNKEELRKLGISDEEINKIALIRENLAVLNEINDQQRKKLSESMNDTFNVISGLKTSLLDTLIESKNIQRLSKAMFILIFLLGFTLVGFSIYFGMNDKDTLAIVFGSFGLASIVAQLIADPPLKLQDARSNYAQLTIASLTWFNDFIEKTNATTTNQQISKNLISLSPDAKTYQDSLDKMLDNYIKVSDKHIDNTVKILNLIEDVAEPSKKNVLSKIISEEKKPDVG